MFSRDFEIPSSAHPMTAPVYLDYHQKATFLFVINGSPVRPENSRQPVGIGRNRDAARRVEGSEGEKENACPKFFGRRASVSGKQKTGQNGKWERWGKTKRKKGPPRAEHFGGPFNNATMKNGLLVRTIFLRSFVGKKKMLPDPF